MHNHQNPALMLLRFVINIHQLCEYKDRVGEGECQNSLLTLYCNDTL